MSEMNDKVRDAVKEELKKHEISEQLGEVEAQLELAQTSITDLTEVLAAKDGELAKLTEERSELLKQLATLDEKLKGLEAKVAEVEKLGTDFEQRAVAAETALADISKDRALEVRMRELEEAKVAKRGEKLQLQKAKVREMSTEEFAAYRDELVEVRAEVEASFKAAAAVEDEKPADEIVTPPADLSAAGKEAAALNVEGATVESFKDRVRLLGEAMANKIQKDVKKELGI